MAEAADEVASYICTNDESKDHEDHGVDQDEKAEGKGKVRHIGCQEH